LNQQSECRHAAPPGHITLTPNRAVFYLTPCVLSV